MSESRRYQMIQKIAERLSAIRVDAGFNTDAGTSIFLGEIPMFGEDDPDEVLAIIVGSDQVSSVMEKVACKVPFEIQALIKVGRRAPLLALEAMVTDIKRAVELPDRSLDGIVIRNSLTREQTRVLDREPGSNFVGVGVAYSVIIGEPWGNP